MSQSIIFSILEVLDGANSFDAFTHSKDDRITSFKIILFLTYCLLNKITVDFHSITDIIRFISIIRIAPTESLSLFIVSLPYSLV